jgi:hypothetical protein
VTTQVEVEADDDGEVSPGLGLGERRYPPRSSARFLHPDGGGGGEARREEEWETVEGEEKALSSRRF